jgi:hypothetical protein
MQREGGERAHEGEQVLRARNPEERDALQRQEREVQEAGPDRERRQRRGQQVREQREREREQREVHGVEQPRGVAAQLRQRREVHLARQRPVVVRERAEPGQRRAERASLGFLQEQEVVVQEADVEAAPVQGEQPAKAERDRQRDAGQGLHGATLPRAARSG